MLSAASWRSVIHGTTVKQQWKNNDETAGRKATTRLLLASLLLASVLLACAEGGHDIRIDTLMSDDPEYHRQHAHYNLADRMASGFGH